MLSTRFLTAICFLLFLLTESFGQCAGNQCAVCSASLSVVSFDGGTLISGTSNIAGTIQAGETATGTSPIQLEVDGCGEITIEVELDFNWQRGNGLNWIHGVSFQASPGWSASQVVLPTPDWIFQNSITGLCSGENFDQGYYYDPVGESCNGGDQSSYDGTQCDGPGMQSCEQNDAFLVDGDPSDNWGNSCDDDCPEFGFILSFCPQIAESTVETIGFYITDDAKTGAWATDDNCIFDLVFEIEFVPQIPEEIIICDGDCIELDAGLGCDSYLWSTGETGNFINVCPLVETDYAITATSSNGCTLIDTITVIPEFCCEAESGDIAWNPVCPGETLDVTVSNYQTLNIYNQYTIVANENGVIIDIVDGDMISLNAEICTTFQVAAYNHYIMDASPIPTIGGNLNNIDCNLYCCDLEITIVEFVDTEPPTFDNPPPNSTIECIDNLEPAMGLAWTDNCNGTGITPLESEELQADICNGGTVTRTWTVVDSCMNEATHSEIITVEPLELPAFINPPADITLQCDFVPGPIPDLPWENTLSGSCFREGMAPGLINGTHDLCGGSYTVFWEFVDECNRIVDFTQNIFIDPVPEAVFISPPVDITVACIDVLAVYPDLMVDNSLPGMCSIQETISPVTTGTYDACGGTLMNVWEFTDACGRTITHPQTVTVLAAPLPGLVAPPADITVNCSSIPTTSNNIDYTNGLTGDCELQGFIEGQLSTLDICSGEIIETWTGNDDCGNPLSHMRTITVEPISPIAFDSPPADVTLNCNNVAANIISLDFSNNADGLCFQEGTRNPSISGSYNECGGLIILEWSADDNCGGSISVTQSITVLPASIASFAISPADITVNCESVPEPIDLDYSNGESGDCVIEGSVPAIVSGSYDRCGGSITYAWEYMDDCNRLIEESQVITVNPASPAVYLDVPDDFTVNCSDASSISNALDYSNGNNSPCDIEGVSFAIITGNYDACGGVLTYNWSHLDDCGQLITEDVIVTVSPAPDPIFIDPPEDITLFCGEAYTPPTPLDYSNFEMGECEISGFEIADVDQTGELYTHTWSYTNACTGITIIHEQFVTLSPELSLTINPLEVNICEGDSYDLSLIDIIENNGNPIQLEYFEGMGSSPNNQLFDLTVSPLSTTIYTVLVFNNVGCEEEVFFIVHVDENPYAGEDGLIELCTPIVVDLVSALGGNQQTGGVWIDQDGSGANLDQPNAINFANILPGTYVYTYQVASGNSCPPDEANVTVNYFQLQEIDIDSVYCDDGNATYTIILQSYGSNITSSHGIVDVQNNGIVHIIEIPIDATVSINYFDPVNLCVGFVNISPPDCDCPQVPLPNVDNLTVCENDFPVTLMAFPEVGTSINWYENIDDEIALQVNTNELLVNQLPVGVYVYYVESESIDFPGCVSATRVPLNLEVVGSPMANFPAETNFCINQSDLPIEIELSLYNLDINTNPANSIEYYSTQDGAFAQNDPIFSISLMENDSVYARVTNVAGCYSILGFEFVLFDIPELSISSLNESCKGENDGSIIVEISPQGNQYILNLNGETYNTSTINNLIPGFYTVEVIDTITACSVVDTISIYEGISLGIESIEFTCNDNGTGIDSADDFYTVECSFTGYENGQFELYEGINLIGSYTYGEIVNFTVEASGSLNEIRIVDIIYGCELIQEFGPLNPCSTNCSLTLEAFQQACDNNNSPSDDTDDFHTIEFNLSSINGSSTNEYIVYINNIPLYTFNYGELAEITLMADGSLPTILLVDIMDEQCSISLPIESLSTCSMECNLTIASIELSCSDNGTINNINDDFYTVEIDLEIVNGSNTEQVDVSIDDENPNQYNVNNIIFDVPADGMIHTIFIVDVDSTSCVDSINIGPLNPCSSDCFIIVDEFIYSCFDNDTPLNPEDDYYVFTWHAYSVEGSADSMYLLNIDGDFDNFYEYSTEYSVNILADNLPYQWEFVDKASPFCINTINIDTLFACSDSCLLDATILDINCQNNGTNNIIEDDIFYVEIIVEGINTNSQWILSLDGEKYNYNESTILGPFTVNDGNVVLEVIDELNLSCPVEIVIESPAPCSSCEQTIEAGENAFIDCDVNTAQLIGTSSEPGNYMWTGPSGILSNDSIAMANQEGWYYFEVNYLDGCQNIDSLFIEALAEIPIAVAGNDSLLTCLVTSIAMTGQYSSNSNDLSFEWMNEDNEIVSITSSILITEDGIYSFRVIDNETGCISAWDDVFIGLNIEEPIAAIFADPGNLLNCVVEFINLSHDEEDDVQYEWSFENETSTEATFTIDSAGVVILIAYDSITGCSSTDSIFIDEVEEFPIINLEPIDQLNCNAEQIIINAINSIPFETSVFNWFTGDNTFIGSGPSIFVDSAGVYIVEVQDTVSGCINFDTILVVEDFTSPIITQAEDAILPCNSSIALLEVFTDIPSVTYNWTSTNGQFLGNTDTKEVDVSGVGLYFIEVTNIETGCTAIDTVEVLELDSDITLDNLTSEDESCINQTDGKISWQSVQGATEPYEIFLNNNLIDDLGAENLNAGDYTLLVIDANGCSYDTLITVEEGNEVALYNSPIITIDPGENGELDITTNIDEQNIDTIIWEPDVFLDCNNCLSNITNTTEDITYEVTIYDINGCSSTTNITIKIRQSTNIYVPNVFTPDEDGINDIFTIFSPDIVEVNILRIYNRWGENVFEGINFPANDLDFGWNGTFKGEKVNPAVFAYYAKVTLDDGTIKELTGDVTVLR